MDRKERVERDAANFNRYLHEIKWGIKNLLDLFFRTIYLIIDLIAHAIK